MTAFPGNGTVPAAQPVSPPGQGFAPARMNGKGHTGSRRSGPALASRAGLLPWLPCCLATGIGIWFALPFAPAGRSWLLVAIVAASGLIFRHLMIPLAAKGRIGWRLAETLRNCGFAIALVAAGVGLMGIRSAHVAAPVLGWRYYGPVEGMVVQIDRSARDRIRLTLDQVVLQDISKERMPRQVRLSLMDQAAVTLPSLGERIRLTGHLGPPPGPASPHGFDFRWNAWFSGLGAVGYTRLPSVNLAPPEGGKWRMHRLRMAISAQIQQQIGGQEGAVAAALMTGDRSGILEATNQIMRGSNLYHIISISGLHMGMLAGFVYAAFRYAMVGLQAAGTGRSLPAHKIAAIFALLAAATYLWLSGGGVATERAFIMVAVMLGAILADRRAISLRTVALAATVILLLRPEALISPGFQMSFAATVALILIYGLWTRIACYIPLWLRPFAMLVTSSLVAGMATAPIAAAHFNQMTHYGLLANLLVVPVMGTLVMPAGVIAGLLAPFGLAGPALWIMGLGTEWMLFMAEWIAGLDGAVTAIIQPAPQVLPLLGAGAVLLVLCWRPWNALRRIAAPLLGCFIGITMVAAAGILWVRTERPMLLIASQGEAAGLMTPAGRALSKPAGGSFTARIWLRQDGDIATQEESARRPGWSGDRKQRYAMLPGGWEVWHFTGKGSGAQAAAACLPMRIVIATERTGLKKRDQQCLLFDHYALRYSGSVAIDFKAGSPVVQTVSAVHRSPG